MHRIFPLTQ
jgi:hypothetical protein